MGLCLALLRRGTPARVEGRDVGKSLAEIVRKLNARSVPNFLEKVESWQARMVKRASKGKNAEAKCADIRDTADTLVAVAEGCSSVREIEGRLKSLFQNSDDKDAVPCVVLSSTHKAKGLEWERVFVLRRTYRSVFANAASLGGMKPGGIEEDNLWYVALTRTKNYLALVEGDGGGFSQVRAASPASKN
jgi:superfamily I DNA/RNA helicase